MTRCVHPRVSRRIWCTHRSKEWWNAVKSGLYGDMWWKQNLRMNKSTFDHTCNELRPYIVRQRTILREPVSVEERVALTLWRLATSIEYRTLAALFGIGRSTACTVFLGYLPCYTKFVASLCLHSKR